MKAIVVVALLLALAVSISITQTHDFYCNKKLTLKFTYAARQGVSFNSNQLNVHWNGKIVKKLAPNDYQLKFATIPLIAKFGQNTLAFSGEGTSDSLGATISHVHLLRLKAHGGGQEDLIKNGDFQQGHSVGTGWSIFKGPLAGWEGDEIEIGHGKIYNSNWKQGTHVCQLDGNHNDVVSQRINFDKNAKCSGGYDEDSQSSSSSSSSSEEEYHHHKPNNHFILKFDYAARLGVPYISSQFSVHWNGQKIRDILPTDLLINTISIPVVGKVGKNILGFHGQGTSDSYGACVTHVSLTKGGKDFIVNGNFEDPNVGTGWKILTGIPGWAGGEIEIGHGKIYNQNWPDNTHVTELDANRNVKIHQEINLNSKFEKI